MHDSDFLMVLIGKRESFLPEQNAYRLGDNKKRRTRGETLRTSMWPAEGLLFHPKGDPRHFHRHLLFNVRFSLSFFFFLTIGSVCLHLETVSSERYFVFFFRVDRSKRWCRERVPGRMDVRSEKSTHRVTHRVHTVWLNVRRKGREKEEAISNLTVIHHVAFFARLDDSLFSYFKRHFVIPPSPSCLSFSLGHKLSLLSSRLSFFLSVRRQPSFTHEGKQKKMVKRMKTNIDTPSWYDTERNCDTNSRCLSVCILLPAVGSQCERWKKVSRHDESRCVWFSFYSFSSFRYPVSPSASASVNVWREDKKTRENIADLMNEGREQFFCCLMYAYALILTHRV